jgi:hypothetical protein
MGQEQPAYRETDSGVLTDSSLEVPSYPPRLQWGTRQFSFMVAGSPVMKVDFSLVSRWGLQRKASHHCVSISEHMAKAKGGRKN